MGKVIGIDLGTTNSVVAIVESGRPKVIVNRQGFTVTPSVVGIVKEGEPIVGQPAKRQAVTHPDRTIMSVKRLMGRRFAEVRELAESLPYEVVPDEDGVAISVDGKRYRPEEISATILKSLKTAAEDYLGEPVAEAVITVPAYFNDAQRLATRRAGELAGLRVRRIINEPTAAALAYALEKQNNETIAVYDFGGGTFDISILRLGDGVVEVVATAGNTNLGGDHIDDRLLEAMIGTFRYETQIDLSHDKMAIQRLREAVENAKIELSSMTETTIHLPFVAMTPDGPKHLEQKLTRAQFEVLMDEIFRSTLDPCRQCLADAGMSAVNHAILVGGSTRIPKVQQMVQELFRRPPMKSLNPDEVVAMGAAVQGAMLSGDLKGVLLLDVTPLSLGIETFGGVFTPLIDRNTTIPARFDKVVSTASDNQSAVEIRVYQGEKPMAADNQMLGVFELAGINPAPRGAPRIEVSFDIDANGILKVSARDLQTDNRKELKIVTKSMSGDQTVHGDRRRDGGANIRAKAS